ncbi:MAG: 3-hydroxyacyl-CoA dehydrogenase family protein [Cyclobacteriaceae bacterium]
MNILVIGEAQHAEECKAKFGNKHTYQHIHGHQEAESIFSKNDVIFDFIIDESPEQMEVYRDHPGIVAFLNTTKISLLELVTAFGGAIQCTLFGFNGLPTFVNRDVLEVALLVGKNSKTLGEVCDQLQTKYLMVDDRVGMVTPRVICMIINEAYFTFQEGTATKEDIDMGMKLGTNYPFGPFEWCDRIGIKHVYELLDAVYEDTKDERYKICPLMKKDYLKSFTPQ